MQSFLILIILEIHHLHSDLEGFFQNEPMAPSKNFQWAILSYEWAIVNEINFQHNHA
jgi:hypothetical protein